MSENNGERAIIGHLLVGVARLWRRAADQALDDCGLSHATAMPLLALSRLGGNARQGVVADYAGLEGPSIVRIADLLLADGLVERNEDPDDRRAKLLTLTDKGRKRVGEIEDILRDLRQRLLTDLDDDDLHATARVLRALEASLIGSEEQR